MSRELSILQHALGVDKYGQGEQYRTHFVTGAGSDDHPTCLTLVEAGLMTRRAGDTLPFGGDDLFHVTEAGRAYVADHSLAPPKLTRGQRRYRAWLSVSDVTGESFFEFLHRGRLPA